MYGLCRSLLFIAFLSKLARCATEPQLAVKTDKGTVVGKVQSGVRQFLSIPYAASPVGANRWKPPSETVPWVGNFNATKLSAACAGTVDCEKTGGCTEDCLVLDVYTPLDVEGSLLPVMVFLPGGAFISGCDDCEDGLYDASNLVRGHQVLVVSVNYRLGAFGWLTLPGTDVGGNLGLLDQRASLKWLQRNAQAFGGDPARVTLWGESAGAMSIGVHMTTNKSEGLFTAAIMESNAAGYSYRTRAEADTVGVRFAQSIPACANSSKDLLDCLRAQNTTVLSIASNAMIGKITSWHDVQKNVLPWTPVVDGNELPDQVLKVFEAGKQLKLPILIGANRNEFDLFMLYAHKLLPMNFTNLEADAAALAIFGPFSGVRVNEWYPSRQFKDPYARTSRVISDWMFLCASDRLAQFHGQAGGKAFVYRFDQEPNFHGGELEYVFGNFIFSNITQPVRAVAAAMQEFWTSFAKQHSPVSHSAAIKWPQFDSTEVHMVINSSREGRNFTYDGAWPSCSLWDSIGYYHASAPIDNLQAWFV